MAPKGYYDPVRRRTDPLETEHLKLPLSVRRTIARAAAKRARHKSEIMREWMEAAANRWLAAQKEEE